MTRKYINQILREVVIAGQRFWSRTPSTRREYGGDQSPPSLGLPRLALCTLLTIFSIVANAHSEELTGGALVVNAGILRISGNEIRLMGIDAPEIDQICWDAGGQPWDCGQQAAAALKGKIQDAHLKCRGTRRDQNARLLVICEVGSVNINAWLVSEGWALAYRSQSLAFVAAEEIAREQAKGIWAGAFEPPSIWRMKHQVKPTL